MNLTFKGFLREYCRELTGLQTDDLRRLVYSCANASPAAAEAVMVFAAVQGKATYAASLAKGTWMEDSFKNFVNQIGETADVEAYLTTKAVPERYKKVLSAYHAKKYAIKADRRVISLMREPILAALEKSGTTIYSVCKQLKLNKGNVYAYLNKGDVSKVSRNTARRIMEFAEAAAR